MNRKRLIITVTSLALVVVAVIAAVVGVLAASQQNVTSTLSVSYQANNVKATVSLEWKYENDQNWTTTAGSQTFTATEGTTTKSLNAVNANQLGSKGTNGATFDRYVIFKFTIHNDYAAAEGRQVTSTLTYTAPTGDNLKNVTVEWDQSTSDDPAAFSFSGTTFTGSDYSTTAPTTAVTIAQGASTYYYLVVGITNVDADAAFTAASVRITLNSVASA